jgi:hypothetical protein
MTALYRSSLIIFILAICTSINSFSQNKDNDKVTNKNLLYQLKGRYFEYIGVETGRRNSMKLKTPADYLYP